MASLDPAGMLAAAGAHPALAALRDRGDPACPDLLLVGGAVRDLALGRDPGDLDLLVDGPLEPILDRVEAVLARHPRFGTATVTVAGESIDLARARRETYRRPGALPTVEPAPVSADLERRDFTINAIALGLTGPHEGRILSVPHAEADLLDGRLRVLHPASFRDDPTRVLRLVRYGARLGFEVEPGTRELLRAALRDGVFGTVSGARLGHELRLLAAEADPVAGFLLLRECGVGDALATGFGLGDAARARAAQALLPPDGRLDRLALALALVDVADTAREPLLDRLRFPARERRRILDTVRVATPAAHRLEAVRRPSEVLEAVRGATIEAVALAGALGPADAARSWLSDLRHRRPTITGADLINAGVAPSPALDAGLRAAHGALLDGLAPSRAEQLEVALRVATGAGR